MQSNRRPMLIAGLLVSALALLGVNGARAATGSSGDQLRASVCAAVTAYDGTTCSAPTTTTQPTTTSQPTTTTAPTTTTQPTNTQTAAQRGVGWYQANTGIQLGHTLTPHGTGDWTLTAADSGKTFTDVKVTGTVSMGAATNVTFNDLYAYRFMAPDGGAGAVLNHCELDGTTLPNDDSADDQAHDGTYNFCNIHGGHRSVQFFTMVSINDSWLHDLRPLSTATHRCNTATNGMNSGGSVLDQRDWFEAGDWNALSGEVCLYGDFAPVNNVTLTGSVLMDSGSYQLYGGSCSGKPYQGSNIHIVNNAFGPFPVTGPPGAQYGAVGCWRSGFGNVWSGNTKLSDGSPVPAP